MPVRICEPRKPIEITKNLKKQKKQQHCARENKIDQAFQIRLELRIKLQKLHLNRTMKVTN
jgi:hypothetical protein